VDPSDLARTLESLQQERTKAEHQLIALQRRVEALRKAADGMEELLSSELDSAEPVPSAAKADAGETPADTPPRQGQVNEPAGSTAAKTILKSDPARFWTVREVWDEQVRRGWANPSKDAFAAVRAALVRLYKRDAPEIERVNAPALAYRFNDGRTPRPRVTEVSIVPLGELPLSNGSGRVIPEEASG
jgi:hypothetical protein